MKLLNKLLTALIFGLRPLLGFAQCKYPLTCTRYAAVVLEQHNFAKAIWLIIKRVASCNPFW